MVSMQPGFITTVLAGHVPNSVVSGEYGYLVLKMDLQYRNVSSEVGGIVGCVGGFEAKSRELGCIMMLDNRCVLSVSLFAHLFSLED